jgi:RES domain-containing protein
LIRLWRITSKQWALNRSGEGARLYGGRFNPKGVPALYAATTIELAALEALVHLPVKPPPLVLVAIDIPARAHHVYRPSFDDLPRDWASEPVASGSQEFGGNWLVKGKGLVMMVPSVIVPEARNAVINPSHSKMKDVGLSVVRPFSFDARFFKP